MLGLLFGLYEKIKVFEREEKNENFRVFERRKKRERERERGFWVFSFLIFW